MVWWVTGPILIWGAKKIYDALAENEPSPIKSYSFNKLDSAKELRDKSRREILKKIIYKNRECLISENFGQKVCDAVKLDGSSSSSEILEAMDYFVILDNLSETINILDPSFSEAHDKIIPIQIFSKINDVTTQIVNKAEKTFGSMAGINAYNEYDKSSDPFILDLLARNLHSKNASQTNQN